jgi:hypothetical protein
MLCTRLYEAEDDVSIELCDDGPNYYGVGLTIGLPFAETMPDSVVKSITVTVSKELLLGLANEIKRQFNNQGYRARGLHNGPDSILAIYIVDDERR